jgi:hypothetical protein
MEKNDVCSLCHTPSNLQPEFADAAAMAGSANMPLRAVGARVHIEPQTDVMAGLVTASRVYPTCGTR